MNATIHITDEAAEEKLLAWGWKPKLVQDEEWYQNRNLGSISVVKWYFGEPSHLYTQQQAFETELSERLLKLL